MGAHAPHGPPAHGSCFASGPKAKGVTSGGAVAAGALLHRLCWSQALAKPEYCGKEARVLLFLSVEDRE